MKNKVKRKTAALMSAVLLSLSLSACGKNVPPLDPPVDPASNVSVEDKNMAFAAETSFTEYLGDIARGNVASDENFRKAVSSFSSESAVKVYEANSDKNFLYSPISLYLALALTADMSDTAVTADLMEKLGAKDKAELEKNVQSIIKALSSETNDEGAEAICRIANSIWTDDQLKLNNENIAELQNVSKKMFADIYNSDLQSEEAVEAMNKWVDEKTAGLIKSIPSEPGSDTRMILFNALYFKKAWEEEIDKSRTKEKEFTKPDGSKIMVPMMWVSPERTGYYESANAMTAPLYYNDGSYMVFIKPANGADVRTVIKNDLEDIIEKYAVGSINSADSVYFTVPKVEYEMQADNLTDIMSDMGVESIFSEENDPFSPIDSGNSVPLYVSDIAQKCKIIINEEGTEAAAVTEVVFDNCESVEEPVIIDMTLDHEYAYVLMSANGTPLFVGAVSDPS